MVSKIFLLLLATITCVICTPSDIQLFADILHFKDIKFAISLLCWSTNDLVKMGKMFSFHQIRIQSWSVSKLNNHTLQDLEFLIEKVVYHRAAILLDAKCSFTGNILEEASNLDLFDAMHHWVILDEPKTFDGDITSMSLVNSYESAMMLAKTNLNIDAEITIAIDVDKGTTYNLYDVYNFGYVANEEHNITYLGEWNKKQGLNISLLQNKYERRSNFNGFKIRAFIVILETSKHFYPERMTSPGIPGVNLMTKLGYFMLELAKEKHNFSTEYVVGDKWVGSFDSSDNMSLVGAMQQKRADIAATGLRVFIDRLTWVDIVIHLSFLQSKFFYRIPTEGVGEFRNEFLRPFAPSAWLVCGAAVGACCLALLAAASLEGRCQTSQFAIFTTMATVCQQSFEEGPVRRKKNTKNTNDHVSKRSRFGARLVVFISCVNSLLLYNYYTSSVVSWLLNAPPAMINNIEELMRSPLELLFEDIGYTRSWMTVPNFYYGQRRPPEENILRNRVKNARRTKPMFVPVDEGIELVRLGGYAYHTEPDTANARISSTFDAGETCELGGLEMMDRVPVYMVAQYHSHYREFFKATLMSISERGHLGRVRRVASALEPQCLAGATPRAVSLGGAAPAHIVLAAGCLIAVLILFAEITLKNYHSLVKKYRLQ